MTRFPIVGLCAALVLAGCGGAAAERRARADANQRSRALAGSTTAQGPDRCEAQEGTHEVSEYDTSGDDIPDVRKVFLRVGTPPVVRLVLICREADLNADGIKDVVRYYTEEGRPFREESDRDFDGQMDEVIFFEDGRIVRMEQDTTGNGQVDTKVYYENGRPVRAERDMAGRSTPTSWHPDRWEYFENSRMVRMGTDIDGDGNVDRWDRDQELRRQQEQQTAQQRAEDADREDAADQEGGGDDGEGDTGGD